MDEQEVDETGRKKCDDGDRTCVSETGVDRTGTTDRWICEDGKFEFWPCRDETFCDDGVCVEYEDEDDDIIDFELNCTTY